MPDTSSLSADDIKLLMGNYQNIIQMNTILLEQQKNLIAAQKDAEKKQESIMTKQNDASNELKRITDKLAEYSSAIRDTNKSMKESSTTISETLQSSNDNFSSWKVDVLKQHDTINRNVYITWGAIATVVLTLVGLLVNAYNKFIVLDQIHHILKQLVQYFHL